MVNVTIVQCSFLLSERGKMARRKDSRGRVLEKGESQRKDGRYVYQYKDNWGVRRSVYALNLSDLRKEERQIRRDMEDKIDTRGAEITLNEQFDKYLALKTRLANSTRQNYINMWNGRVKNSSLGRKRICDIKKSDVLRFYNDLQGAGLKYSTIKLLHGMIAPCLELAVEDDVLRKNPSRGCLREFESDAEERAALTKKEQEELLAFVWKSNVYAVYYPMLLFMIGTAVRCGEAIGLTWKDVDFKKREISINHQLVYKKKDGGYGFYADTPKTDAGIRIIPMTREVCRALMDQREQQLALGRKTNVCIDGYEDFVFSTKNRNPIMPSAVNNFLLNIVNAYNKSGEKKVQMPHISAHILRHTGCTRMSEAGIDPKVLQYIMGHSNISVTMEVYNHVSTERSHKEIEKLEQIRRIV